jgi:hypothetical protein
MFDYALQEDELYRALIEQGASRQEFRSALAGLLGRCLSREGSYLTWLGRERLGRLRQQRSEAGRVLWRWAHRYGRWLACVPFVRMAAVSGSLAVENASGEADVDFFIITEKKRLWIARFCLVFLRLLTRSLPRLFPVAACPNYLLSLAALEIENRSLYTAHEVVQAVPLWGAEAYQRFLLANAWVEDYLPNAGLASPRFRPPPPPAHRLVRTAERLLGGLPGDLANAALYRLFALYHRSVRSAWLAARLEKQSQARRAFRQGYLRMIQIAFRPERQASINGGYAGTIRQRFVELVQARLGQPPEPGEIDRLFPPGPPEEAPSEGRLYTQEHHHRLFLENYGNRL